MSDVQWHPEQRGMRVDPMFWTLVQASLYESSRYARIGLFPHAVLSIPSMGNVIRQELQLPPQPPAQPQQLPPSDPSLQSPFASLASLGTSPTEFSYSALLGSAPRMELTQLQAHSSQFGTTPPSLPELPLPSASGPQLQISQPLTSGQPPDSSAAPSASAVLELSATGLVQL